MFKIPIRKMQTPADPEFLKGGEGSGNFNHSGRPGERGGSDSEGVAGELEQSKQRAIAESGKVKGDIDRAKSNLKAYSGHIREAGRQQASKYIEAAESAMKLFDKEPSFRHLTEAVKSVRLAYRAMKPGGGR